MRLIKDYQNNYLLKLKIFIPFDMNFKIDRKKLFILVRPFYTEQGWKLDLEQIKEWNLNNKISLVYEISNADILLFPYPINSYLDNDRLFYLKEYSIACKKNKIYGYGFISGDYGQAFPEFNNLIYFRLGGFNSQLSSKNIGFPVSLSDHHNNLFGSKNILIREKKSRPVIGFCGHANPSQIKRFNESFSFILKNISRLIKNPFRKDYEPIFPSGYNRYKLLAKIQRQKLIKTNFIFRDKYRAGSQSVTERKITTIEYYNNLRNSDYIICLRGSGNFSARFYETLLMGRIPVLINTDCLIPLEKIIDWKKHIILIDWKDRNNLVDIVQNFHNNLSHKDFIKLQLDNRSLWLEKLQPHWILNQLNKYKPSQNQINN